MRSVHFVFLVGFQKCVVKNGKLFAVGSQVVGVGVERSVCVNEINEFPGFVLQSTDNVDQPSLTGDSRCFLLTWTTVFLWDANIFSHESTALFD